MRTAFIRAMEDAKKAGEIPKTATIDKIGKLPKEVPSRWSATYKRIFGRKSPLGKPAAEKPAEKPADKTSPNKKAPAKKKVDEEDIATRIQNFIHSDDDASKKNSK